MNKSESIAKLAEALSKAQGEIRAAKFNSVNPFLKNKYADLGAIIDAARTPLANHGLAVSQPVSVDETGIGIETILMHSSGEWISSTAKMPMIEERGKSAAQVAGSIITYLRRYSLASIVGVYADEDTDGNEPKKDEQKKSAPAAQPEPERQAQTAPAMMVEEAIAVVNTQGVKYGDLPSEKLVFMANSLAKIKEQTDEQRMKAQAIKVILASRQS